MVVSRASSPSRHVNKQVTTTVIHDEESSDRPASSDREGFSPMVVSRASSTSNKKRRGGESFDRLHIRSQKRVPPRNHPPTVIPRPASLAGRVSPPSPSADRQSPLKNPPTGIIGWEGFPPVTIRRPSSPPPGPQSAHPLDPPLPSRNSAARTNGTTEPVRGGGKYWGIGIMWDGLWLGGSPGGYPGRPPPTS
jgi:hypothetical protein